MQLLPVKPRNEDVEGRNVTVVNLHVRHRVVLHFEVRAEPGCFSVEQVCGDVVVLGS